MELQKLMDAAGITFIGASNGEKGQSTNFIDVDQIPKTMADHIAFCRDFCNRWAAITGRSTWAHAPRAAPARNNSSAWQTR